MKRYNSINGLRSIACIGIILMHVKANINYKLDSEALNTIISSFTQFVYLFFIISAFSMCCGYYEKIKNNEISMNDFYKKRFLKILPFFSFLVLIEIVSERAFPSIYEGFMDITLLFGFLPVNDLSVIGVAWFLGVVCLFYIFFPFFVFLMDNKKRAWIFFIISFIINILCKQYFFTETFRQVDYPARNNFLYDLVYFSIGGIMYLYRNEIEHIVSKFKNIFVFVSIVFSVLYFVIPYNDILFTIEMLVIFSTWLCTAIGIDTIVLDNKITTFISKISMEMYLSHMMIFRITEKIHITHLLSNNYLSYILTSLFVIVGAIFFSIIVNKFIVIVKEKIDKVLIDKKGIEA